MNNNDVKIILGEIGETLKVKSTLTTVGNLQYEKYKTCLETLGLSEDCYTHTIYDVIVFAKINILLEANIITEDKFYSLSDSYIQYLCAKKEHGRILNTIDENDRTQNEIERLDSLDNEINELEETFNKYMLLDFEMDVYSIIGDHYLLKIRNQNNCNR